MQDSSARRLSILVIPPTYFSTSKIEHGRHPPSACTHIVLNAFFYIEFEAGFPTGVPREVARRFSRNTDTRTFLCLLFHRTCSVYKKCSERKKEKWKPLWFFNENSNEVHKCIPSTVIIKWATFIF